MNVATCTREMRFTRSTKPSAFTIIELLVVIAIMLMIAGLVVWAGARAGEHRKISRAEVERDKLVTLIENYKAKVGVYPPDNRQIPFNPAVNSLFYELAGARRTPHPGYTNDFGVFVLQTALRDAFGIDGMINASDDRTEIKWILKDLKPDQTNEVVPGTISLVVPIDGPGPNRRPNPWRYATGTNAIHNPESFDLWVEIYSHGKTNSTCANCIIIGNWKN